MLIIIIILIYSHVNSLNCFIGYRSIKNINSIISSNGLYGIRNKLALTQPVQQGNGYLETRFGVLPRTLEQATAAMKNSSIAKELFGESFTAHFVATREWEWKQHLKYVTDWEMKRYFEII